MNEIIDNEFGAVKNFLSKYKNALMIVVLLIILSVGLFVLNFYNKKVMNEEAAVIYNEWLNTTSLENKEQLESKFYINLKRSKMSFFYIK